MTLILYGIPNCDTVKKARDWLAGRGVPYEFHDYKKLGIEADRLRGWIGQIGWEKVLNRAGTTFRALPPESKLDLDEGKAIALMVAQPSMIKRPIFEAGGQIVAGFKPDSAELTALIG
ncbi:MAG: arsenate reductase [Asticcacaulis sp.]|uniref:arsenate reductase n=1 Tax=Asticcacaulis sp. TaxID=1872648 RepID=UPI0039E60934